MDWKTHSLPSLGRVSCSEDTFDGSSDCTRESDYNIRKTGSSKRGAAGGSGGNHGGNRRSQSMVATDDDEIEDDPEETAEETHGSEELDHFSGYSQEFIDGRRQFRHHHPGGLQRQMSTPVQPSRWLQQQHQQQLDQSHPIVAGVASAPIYSTVDASHFPDPGRQSHHISQRPHSTSPNPNSQHILQSYSEEPPPPTPPAVPVQAPLGHHHSSQNSLQAFTEFPERTSPHLHHPLLDPPLVYHTHPHQRHRRNPSTGSYHLPHQRYSLNQEEFPTAAAGIGGTNSKTNKHRFSCPDYHQMEMALEKQHSQANAPPTNARDRFLKDASKAGVVPPSGVGSTRRELPPTPSHMSSLQIQGRIPPLEQHQGGGITNPAARFEDTFLASGPLPQAPMISPDNPGHSVIHYDSGYQGESGVVYRMYRPPSAGAPTPIPSQRPTTRPPQQVQRVPQTQLPAPEDFEHFRQQGAGYYDAFRDDRDQYYDKQYPRPKHRHDDPEAIRQRQRSLDHPEVTCWPAAPAGPGRGWHKKQDRDSLNMEYEQGDLAEQMEMQYRSPPQEFNPGYEEASSISKKQHRGQRQEEGTTRKEKSPRPKRNKNAPEGSPKKTPRKDKGDSGDKEKRKSRTKHQLQQQQPSDQQQELRYIVTEQEYQRNVRIAKEGISQHPHDQLSPAKAGKQKKTASPSSARKDQKKSHHHHHRGTEVTGEETQLTPPKKKSSRRQEGHRQTIRRQAQVEQQQQQHQQHVGHTASDVSDAFDDDGLFHFGEEEQQQHDSSKQQRRHHHHHHH